MKKILAGAIVAAVACGCVSVNKNDGGEACMRMKVCKDVIHAKVAVDAQTITAEDNINCLFGFICWGSTATHTADQTCDLFAFGPTAKAKNGAYANACDAAKCDQLVATRYKITVNDYYVFKTVKAEVTGYPAKVTGVEVLPAPCCKGPKPEPCCKK